MRWWDNHLNCGSGTYGEDSGGDSVDEQRLSAVSSNLPVFFRLLPHFGGGVVSVQPVVDVEPPEDAGSRWHNKHNSYSAFVVLKTQNIFNTE